MKESRTVSERRFSLLVALRRGHPTIRDILAMPAYSGIAPANAQRYVERDLEELRVLGYQIDVDSEHRYILADHNISVDGSDVEMSILRSLLATKGSSQAFVAAQSAVTKLLSSGQASGEQSHLIAHIPSGDAALAIAPALQRRRRIAFFYRSTRSMEPARYVVEPLRLEVHFDAFYLRGYQLSGGAGSAPGMRMYKLDRVEGEVTILEEAISHELDPSFVSTLSPVDAVVRISRDLPLRVQAAHVEEMGGEMELSLNGIDRAHLYEDLMFYGLDARLTGPGEVRADFISRLEHLAGLAQEGELDG
ncbi:helix-turn-helix transcriptional regulator [Trueperella pyogenes]|uniref:helix-turn-helix transcriptional regulator n=1 Tax=Trueperella pyogenes TaxID=1661 RepID=UPI0032490537